MDSKKINLPEFVIANLFADQLVLISDTLNVQNLPSTSNSNDLPVLEAKSKQQLTNQPIETKKESGSKTKQPIAEEQEKKWYLGNNQKQITILIKESGVAFINDKHLQLLTNILNACKLNLGDIALVNHTNHALTAQALKEKLNSKIIIAFDIDAKLLELPFLIPNYQIQEHNHCIYLFTASLEKMDSVSQEAKIEKAKLWESLKSIFKI